MKKGTAETYPIDICGRLKNRRSFSILVKSVCGHPADAPPGTAGRAEGRGLPAGCAAGKLQNCGGIMNGAGINIRSGSRAGAGALAARRLNMKDYVFGNLLASLRAEKGFSQFQLGRILGVSDKAVSKWETGNARPRMNICIRLSELLGISLDALLGNDAVNKSVSPDMRADRTENTTPQNRKSRSGPNREDGEEEKRVELHARTGMSETDGIASAADYFKRASQWGQPAVAITDFCVTHEMPRAFRAAKKTGVKLIPGCEGWMIPDEKSAMEDGCPVMLLAVNRTGLVNLNRLVSLSHILFFNRIPCMPRKWIGKYREGLLVGSACDGGEIARAVLAKTDGEELRRIAEFYDYYEVQPPENESASAKEQAKARWLIKRIADLGDETGKPVAAVGNVRYLDPQDSLCRAVIRYNAGIPEEGGKSAYYCRTTREMLDAFAFLGERRARQLVVSAPRGIADRVDAGITLTPEDGKRFYPSLPGARETLLGLCDARARTLYGDPLPECMERRIMTETAMLDRHDSWSVMEIARRIVEKSNKDGYSVGSRGSVGSSLIAWLCGVAEADPLPPHYRCPRCRKSLFPPFAPQYRTGPDLPEKDCPVCGQRMIGDGYDIPPEPFFGVRGEKDPDIDLNLAEDEAAVIKEYIRKMFGADHVFVAGTLGTLAPFRIGQYVRRYLKDHQAGYTEEQVSQVSERIGDSKRTVGRHPAGIVIVPDGRDINEFTPIQYPASDSSWSLPVTHYDFSSLWQSLLKMDILRHESPALLRLMTEKTGVAIEDIPLKDKGVMSLFRSPEALGVTARQILSSTGTYGIPEFSSEYARELLAKIRPASIEELIRFSGFTHGTGIWQDNAEKLVESGRAGICDCPAFRDDVLNDLVRGGAARETACRIMEQVRMGKKLTDDMVNEIKKADLPEWYADYCDRVLYMFPRAHAAAYLIPALRIAWFKLYRPEAFYLSFFETIREGYSAADFLKDETRLRKEILEARSNNEPSSPEDRRRAAMNYDRERALELILEMTARGISLPWEQFAPRADEPDISEIDEFF